MGTVSRRAAEAYARSEARLESSCGISDVWYNYVESNFHLFIPQTHPATPSGPDGSLNLPVVPQTSRPPIHPRPHPQEMKEIEALFSWHKAHTRPRPTKKEVTADISPFSKASAHPSLRAVSPKNQEDTGTSRKSMEVENNVQAGKQPVLVKEEAEIQPTDGSSLSVGGSEGASDFGFDDWPENSSFSRCLGLALDQAAADSSDPGEGHLSASKGEMEMPEVSRKRARSDSDDRKGSLHPLPPTYTHRILTADERIPLDPTEEDGEDGLGRPAKKQKGGE